MKTSTYSKSILIVILICLVSIENLSGQTGTYPIVDTGQAQNYNNSSAISAPQSGQAFFGQDAQHNGNQPSYTNNGDGTITDNVTWLMWQKSPDMDGDGDIDADDKLSYDNAMAGASSFDLAGYNDWRLPTIKELYSLIMFFGEDPSGYNGTSTDGLTPFIDTDYFEFGFGDTNAGERIIDAQFASSTLYVSTTMGGAETMFGVNFADGRIKGYPTGPMPGRSEDKGYYVLYVRGNTNYGQNDFTDNSQTVTDNATGLMWEKNDSQEGLNWEEALAWILQKNGENYLDYDDWRLPDVKELQSIVDYTRSPSTTNSAAINPLFTCSAITDEGGEENYPCFWSGTTHANMQTGSNAAYVAFGEALGYMNGQWMDVHGAGAQRSDPKAGDPADWPTGHGPQGDAIRIYNYVRCVRDAETTTGIDDNTPVSTIPESFSLQQNYPNPFNPSTSISFSLPNTMDVKLSVFNLQGQQIKTLVSSIQSAGNHEVTWDGTDENGVNVASGLYICQVIAGNQRAVRKMSLMK